MATVPSKANPFKVNVRAGLTRALAMKNNEFYAQTLSAGILGLGKKVLGVYAASALDLAIRETVRDSGRAAANWDLAFSGAGLRSNWAPGQYGTPPIGFRGDRNAGTDHIGDILSWKESYYGTVPSGKYMKPVKNGILARSINMCSFGPTRKVQLFNPIFSEATGKYAEHAFPGFSKVEALYGKFRGVVEAEMTSDFIPLLVDELRRELKTFSAKGGLKKVC